MKASLRPAGAGGGAGGAVAVAPPTALPATPALAAGGGTTAAPLKCVWVVNDLSGEGQNHVLAAATTPIKSQGGEVEAMFYGNSGSEQGKAFPITTTVGATVHVVGLWEGGCCYDVAGVYSSKSKAMQKAQAVGGDVSSLVVEG